MISNNARDEYNMRKIKKFNSIDQVYNKDELKNLIINPQKIEKPNINIETLVQNRNDENNIELQESIKKRVNLPYKGIIKDFNYNKVINSEKDLIIHKVSSQDKIHFNEDMSSFKNKNINIDKEIKDTYSIDKQTTHKKEFEYQHKYKYRTKLESSDNGESDLRTDRIEFYKKEQNKLDDNKKKIDDILLNLIDSGVLSENLDSINYDKINAKELEDTLKNVFGEDEFNKLVKELN
jgi:hypothetical protein